MYANESDSRIVELTGQHQQLSFYSFFFILFFRFAYTNVERMEDLKKTYMYNFPFSGVHTPPIACYRNYPSLFFWFPFKSRCVYNVTHTLVCRCLHWRACECVCLFFCSYFGIPRKETIRQFSATFVLRQSNELNDKLLSSFVY